MSNPACPYIQRNEPGHWDSGGRVVVPFENDDQMRGILKAVSAQRIEAQSDETNEDSAQPEGREPGPKDAPR